LLREQTSSWRTFGAVPVISIDGDNPDYIQVGDTYADLGADITSPASDQTLGIRTFDLLKEAGYTYVMDWPGHGPGRSEFSASSTALDRTRPTSTDWVTLDDYRGSHQVLQLDDRARAAVTWV
jgi:hypothetical protein